MSTPAEHEVPQLHTSAEGAELTGLRKSCLDRLAWARAVEHTRLGGPRGPIRWTQAQLAAAVAYLAQPAQPAPNPEPAPAPAAKRRQQRKRTTPERQDDVLTATPGRRYRT